MGGEAQSPCVQKPSQFPLFRAHFSKKTLPSIVMAAADCCAGDKDRATRCRPHARAGVQACRGARASSSKIPVVKRRGWRPIHKRKAEDAWSCARRRRRRSCSSRSAVRRPDAGSCHRGRELVARATTAGDPAASAVLRALCAVRRLHLLFSTSTPKSDRRGEARCTTRSSPRA